MSFSPSHFVSARSGSGIYVRQPSAGDFMSALQTPRLILRSFSASDLDRMAILMANEDFMRFSIGVYGREQTAGFIERVCTRDRASLPSQFAVIYREDNQLVGYSGFLLQAGAAL